MIDENDVFVIGEAAGAVSSYRVRVLFPGESGDGTVPLYQSTLTFTRAREGSGKNEKRKDVNAETLLMRRKDMDRDKVKTINDLFTENIINRSWPSNGSLGDLQMLLGI